MDPMQNPLLATYHTPYHTAPFHLIKTEHYEPAILKGMEMHNEEIEAIINNPEQPTFHNTIVALERSGATLDRAATIFGNLLSAETSDELQAIAQRVMPQLSEHSNNISLNEKLFARIKAVYDSAENTQLNQEDRVLLDKTYDGFIRNGANLPEADKERFRQISSELSVLTLQFSQNNLNETNSYELPLTLEQLDGIPESVIEAYAQTAKEKDKEGYVVTLHAPSLVPFLKYSRNRELRKQLYMAYNTQCIKDNENNNTEIVKKLVNLRLERAQLLGFQTAADYVLTKRMAENSLNVYQLLNQLLEAYTPTAHKELAEVVALAKELEDEDFELMPWDWAYYSEKLKEKRFNLNEEELRPYFELGKVIEGVFGLATRLYGITFKKNEEIPVYHPDVETYEVYDENQELLAILYTDFHPRTSKRSGAWMTSFKEQWKDENGNSRPHVSITMNFTGLADFLGSEHILTRVRPCPARHVCQHHLSKPQRYQCVLGLCGTAFANHGELCHREGVSEYICKALSDQRAHTCRNDSAHCECIELQRSIRLSTPTELRLARHGLVHPYRTV